MKVNDISLGSMNPIRLPQFAATLGDAIIEGGPVVVYGKSGSFADMSVKVWVQSDVALAGNAAGSQAGNEALARWLEEISRNTDLQSLLVVWSSLRSLPQDGWWFLSSCQPDYTFTSGGRIPVSMTFRHRAQLGAPLSVYWSGGALPSVYTAVPVNLLAFPQNAGGLSLPTRTGAEGGYPYFLNPPGPGPVGFLPSATLSDLFKAGCHVYDAMAGIATNPVPGSGFLNANWLEARGTDHQFVGDLIVTNGLLLLTIAINGSVQLWGWSTVTGAWSLAGTIQGWDTNGVFAPPTAARITKVSYEEVAVDVFYVSTTNTLLASYRLQRGQRLLRFGLSPRSYSNVQPFMIRFAPSVGGALRLFNESKIASTAFDSGVAPSAIYPYGSGFVPSASWPWVASFLYQARVAGEKPTSQPAVPPAAQPYMDLGDTTGPAQYQTRFYALGLTSINTANLQQAMYLGGFGAGFSQVADAATSPGQTLKAASGTVSGIAATAGAGGNSTFSLSSGLYDIWFRVRVTSAAGAAAEMSLGIRDSTSATDTLTTFKANQSGTTYGWLRAVVGYNPTSGHVFQFKALTAGTLGTDWFIDEGVAVPKTLTTFSDGPQDLAQQFLHEKTTRFPVV